MKGYRLEHFEVDQPAVFEKENGGRWSVDYFIGERFLSIHARNGFGYPFQHSSPFGSTGIFPLLGQRPVFHEVVGEAR